MQKRSKRAVLAAVLGAVLVIGGLSVWRQVTLNCYFAEVTAGDKTLPPGEKVLYEGFEVWTEGFDMLTPEEYSQRYNVSMDEMRMLALDSLGRQKILVTHLFARNTTEEAKTLDAGVFTFEINLWSNGISPDHSWLIEEDLMLCPTVEAGGEYEQFIATQIYEEHLSDDMEWDSLAEYSCELVLQHSPYRLALALN
jgi:hypothetical protein